MAGTAVPVEGFANNPSGVIAVNGYASGSATGDAPAQGTLEAWTFVSTAAFFPASSSATPPTQMRIADQAAPSEVVLVSNISGAVAAVTRGAEGTTPVTHAAGATFYQVITAGVLGSLNPGDGDFYGNTSAPAWPLYGAWLYASGGSLKSLNADGNAYEIGELTAMSSAAVTTATTATSNITGLAAALGPGCYFLDIRIPYAPTVTGGAAKFGFATSGAPTVTAMNLMGAISLASDAMSTTDLSGTAVLVTGTTLSASMWTSPKSTWASGDQGFGIALIWGTITVSAAGTLQLTITNGTSGDDFTVPAGAVMIISPAN